jgi:hypothetical protein
MDYVIAIPSYKRYKQLRDKTLAFLQREGFDPNTLYVFVANDEEKTLYEKELVPNTYKEILVGRLGLANQRNFIYDYFPLGQKILMMDDDIEDLLFLNPRPMKEMVERMWTISEEEGATLWSIYPVSNKYFCVERVVVGQVFCVGCFHGVVNTRDYYPDMSASEDRWITCKRYSTDGKTLRYEGCCPKTRYFAKGGLEEYRKTGTNQYDDTISVTNMFPNLCKLKQYKKNGMWDAVIRLKYTHTRQLFD